MVNKKSRNLPVLIYTIVATMIHEVIHGLINGKTPSNVPIGDRKEWLNNFEHETMANEYVDLMTNTLILLFPNMSRADASSLSWGGLDIVLHLKLSRTQIKA